MILTSNLIPRTSNARRSRAPLFQKRENRKGGLFEIGHQGEKNAHHGATHQHGRKNTLHDVDVEVAFFLAAVRLERVVGHVSPALDAGAIESCVLGLAARTHLDTHSVIQALTEFRELSISGRRAAIKDRDNTSSHLSAYSHLA